MKKLIYLSAVIVCIFSCNKKEPNKIVPIDSELLQYFDYKLGSYWVFKNNKDMQIDTFTVVYNREYNVASQVTHVEHEIKISNNKNIYDYIIIGLSKNTIGILYEASSFGFETPFNYNIPAYTIEGNIFYEVKALPTSNQNKPDSLYLSKSKGIIRIKSEMHERNLLYCNIKN